MNMLQVPKVAGALFREFPGATVTEVLKLLNSSKVGQRKLRFTYTNRFFVRCPSCKKNRLNLYDVEGTYACGDCRKLKRNRIRRRERSSSRIVYARYLRPIRILIGFDEKLANESLSARQRLLVENKREKLVQAVPEYVLLLKDSCIPAQGGRFCGTKKFL